MLPYKTQRGSEAFMRLRCYEGVPWDIQDKPRKVIPEAVKCLRLKSNRKFTRMNRLSEEFGWKHGALIESLKLSERTRRSSQLKLFRFPSSGFRKCGQRSIYFLNQYGFPNSTGAFEGLHQSRLQTDFHPPLGSLKHYRGSKTSIPLFDRTLFQYVQTG